MPMQLQHTLLLLGAGGVALLGVEVRTPIIQQLLRAST